jgi:FAD-linked sulfhydryl oxidase
MNEFMNIKNKKDCDECVDFKDWLAQQKNSSEKSSKERQKSESKTQMKDQQDQAQVKEQPLFTSESYENECPLFRDQLGRVAWTYLHSMAAYYPTKPSEKDKQAMDNFIHSFAHFFPCKECAEDFKEELSFFQFYCFFSI